jgi:hypothetical protein
VFKFNSVLGMLQVELAKGLMYVCGSQNPVNVKLNSTHRSFDIVEATSHLALATGPRIKGVWVEAVPHLVTGDLEGWASFANVEPSRIPGYCFDKSGTDVPIGQKPSHGEKVLYFVGCGYTHLPSHLKHGISDIGAGILQAGKCFRRAFAIEFRLSTTDPHNPPPSLLQSHPMFYRPNSCRASDHK